MINHIIFNFLKTSLVKNLFSKFSILNTFSNISFFRFNKEFLVFILNIFVNIFRFMNIKKGKIEFLKYMYKKLDCDFFKPQTIWLGCDYSKITVLF
ncbi:hypothetical protein CHH97_01530 [Bacillus licheniformis]|nr:hypothetical protein LI17339_02780 [Bacillus licheniformis LMG 17339]PAD02712.1 hypothetical protein CHH89_02010 [Bacillus licheniformis]PAD52642.1 hypothetical protein CHH98_02400 [Bacillus licheniformis]PAD57362.1 hypothetical protein CHH97_01530 [Bacillus licheniformis]PAE52158.1 hypothetical protein CHH95_03965 [Bacillus licheniformis]